MLRTILVRNQVLGRNVKKTIRSSITRCLSTELLRRKQCNTSRSPKSQILQSPWTTPMRLYASYPDHTPVTLPALSPTMETGTIVKWAKKEGDKLSEGDLLCEIETDKATMGFETPEEGYLAKILVPAGTKGVPVGQIVCIIVADSKDVANFKDYKADAASAAPQAPKAAPAAHTSAPAQSPPAPRAAPAPAPAPRAAPAPAAPSANETRVYASPFAARIAENRKLKLAGQGSGLYGSLKSSDLSAAAAQSPAAAVAPAVPGTPAVPGAAFVDIPLSGMRETIAKRLTAAKQSIPHYQLTAKVNIEKTLKMRQKLNDKIKDSGDKVSINDFIIKAMASACKRVPAVNAYWMESYIRQFTNVDVSVAVATPTGLITPIIRNANSQGVLEISRTMKELAVKAKTGTLQPQEYQGGTVTVSNLGMFGITMFNAIINPPQSLILACGGLQEAVIMDKNEPQGFRVAKFVYFTVSADHRVIDGAVGAQWMKEFKDNIEDPVNSIL